MQSKFSSAIESILNQFVGTLLIYIFQKAYFWAFEIYVTTQKHMGLIVGAMIISMVKHYVIRRYFNKEVK